MTLGLCSVSLIATPVFAATSEPESKCVTAKTKATYANVTALMEKDIAPYAKTASATAAIEAYRQTMTIAWDAMKEPYCGFGSYGTASAIKSYAKNVARARATFLAQAKGKPVSAATTAPAPKPAPLAVVPEPKAAPTAVTAPTPSSIDLTSLRGLHRGMDTLAVLNLQKLLNRYLGPKADDSILTGFFGPKTEKILIQFQINKHIIDSADEPGAGLVGPKTAAALSKL